MYFFQYWSHGHCYHLFQIYLLYLEMKFLLHYYTVTAYKDFMKQNKNEYNT
ncbi:hypothetical protein bthur0002_57500 [Bacillus thuringiensis Bt407]|nr:hypothetical protein bthur0002_57500 [Bacillus thuringiensis Bt407]